MNQCTYLVFNIEKYNLIYIIIAKIISMSRYKKLKNYDILHTMTIQARTKMFMAFSVIFFISLPIIVLYTQGYRVDLDQRKLVKTGGIDLEIKTADTKMYFNGKLKKQTNIVFNNVVFRNILPGNYDILIEKDGYQSWHKNIQVTGGRVTQISSIKLFPQNPTRIVVENKLNTANISQDAKYALVYKQATENNPENLSLITLRDSSTKPVLIMPKNEKIEKTEWSFDSKNFYILTNGSSGKKIYTGTVNNPEELQNWTNFLRINYPASYYASTKIIPTSSPKVLLFALQDANGTFTIASINLDQKTIKAGVVKNALTFTIANEEIFHLDKSGLLKKTNASTGNTTELTNTAISKLVAKNLHITVSNDQKSATIINSGDLFLWKESKPLEKIANSIIGVSFSHNNKILAFWDQNIITVYWLEKIEKPPQRVEGNKEIISEFSNIENVLWISKEGSHIAIKTSDNVVLTEIDSRFTRNSTVYTNLSSGTQLLNVDINKDIIYVLLTRQWLMAVKFN